MFFDRGMDVSNGAPRRFPASALLHLQLARELCGFNKPKKKNQSEFVRGVRTMPPSMVYAESRISCHLIHFKGRFNRSVEPGDLKDKWE